MRKMMIMLLCMVLIAFTVVGCSTQKRGQANPYDRSGIPHAEKWTSLATNKRDTQ